MIPRIESLNLIKEYLEFFPVVILTGPRHAPSTTKSMYSVMADLQLEKLYVAYPGKKRYPLSDKIELISIDI